MLHLRNRPVLTGPLWAQSRLAAVRRKTPFRGYLNVGFQCRGMAGSRLQRKSGFRPSRRVSATAALVTMGSLRPFAAQRTSDRYAGQNRHRANAES